MAESGYVPFEVCTFKGSGAGRDRDRYYQHKKFPTSMSIETIRLAWLRSGMRAFQLQARANKIRTALLSRWIHFSWSRPVAEILPRWD